MRTNIAIRAARGLALCVLSTVASGCSSGSMTLGERTVTSIGPAGGRAVSADGAAVLVFSPGALRSTREVEVETDRTRADPRLVSPVYRVAPADLSFAGDVRFEVEVSEMGQLVLAQLVEGTFAALGSSAIDDGGRVTAPVRGAGRFGVIREPVLCDVEREDGGGDAGPFEDAAIRPVWSLDVSPCSPHD